VADRSRETVETSDLCCEIEVEVPGCFWAVAARAGEGGAIALDPGEAPGASAPSAGSYQ